MEKSSQNIQDSFLNNARKEKMIITIYLVGGVRLNGRIKSFDKYSLILEANNQEHLVFKHAISTVATGRQAHSAAASSANSGGTAPQDGSGDPPENIGE
jgi:host factor-I protein